MGRHIAHRHSKHFGAFGIGALIMGLLAVVLLVATIQSTPRATKEGTSKGVLVANQVKHRVINADSRTRSTFSSTLIATLSTSVPKYAAPGGIETGTVPGTWFGSPSSLPVIAQDAGYLEVRLAQRPNGSTAWISASSVTLHATPYRILINLSTEHLELFDNGNLILEAPAGIGTVADPTPTGNYFVAFYAAAPSSSWGPFIMVTSGHSNAISDWEKSGDAIVAIHGPLGAEAAIGTTGARVSHGCVRLQDADLAQLKVVPAGTPVDIIAQ